MPPRFVFWTIILDGQPTAFRAAEREQLLPTLKQLQAKNPNAVLKWFAHGRVWDSPEELWQLKAKARADARETAVKERRDRGWRPGGDHKDPREKFKRETFQARKRRDKKAANLAGGAAARPRPGPPAHPAPAARPGAPTRPVPAAQPARAARPAGTEPPAEPGRPAPSHKTRQPRLRKPR